MWGSGGGVGGDVADLEGLGPQGCDTVLEGLGPQGCDERGGAGTLTCGNGPGNSVFTETALLDEVHSTERFWCGRIALACGNGVHGSQFPEEDNEDAMASEPGASPPPPQQGSGGTARSLIIIFSFPSPRPALHTAGGPRR